MAREGATEKIKKEKVRWVAPRRKAKMVIVKEEEVVAAVNEARILLLTTRKTIKIGEGKGVAIAVALVIVKTITIVTRMARVHLGAEEIAAIAQAVA